MLETLRGTNRRAGGTTCRRLLAAIASVTIVVVPVVARQATARAATGSASVCFNNFTDRSTIEPEGIAAGPDGALWFTSFNGNSIGRITTGGAITHYTDPTIHTLSGITTGPDGALWFTNIDTIGRITTGGTITSFTNSTIFDGFGITAGPDGALWFTNEFGGPNGSGSIGRITTDGTVTNYTDPTIRVPHGITTGPDGALWFTNSNGASIGRITTDGTITNYADPTISDPERITTGSDGALWFTNSNGGSIGRITTNGTVTNFTDPTIRFPVGITAGSDGALWFTSNLTGVGIGRITTDGTVTNYADPTFTSGRGITVGPDGALWFTQILSGTSGHLSIQGSIRRSTVPPQPCVVPSGGSVTEADSGTSQLPITVTLSAPSTQTVTAQWNTAFGNGYSDVQAIPGTDYIAASGTVTFPPGTTTETVPITVLNHDLSMSFKVVLVSFHDPTNAIVDGFGGLAFGIINNIPPEFVVPSGGSVTEGPSGTTSQLPITVTLSRASTVTVTAQWNTAFAGGVSNVEAIPGTDYTPASGTVTFPPGATTETVPITVLNHDLGMPFKVVLVSFHDPTNATIGGFGGLAFGVMNNNTG